MIYILFVVIYGNSRSASFQRDFKTKEECEGVLRNFEKRFFSSTIGFCQEIRK